MEKNRRPIVGLFTLGFIVLLGVTGLLRKRLRDANRSDDADLAGVSFRLAGVMGTEGELTAVVPSGRKDLAESARSAAEAELRKVEALMSTRLDASQLSRFNSAPAGELVPLSQAVLEVLRVSKEVAEQSDGAFDVTCRPLLQLWKRSAKQGRRPNEQELKGVREIIGWRWITLHPGGAEKSKDAVSVDLGGIAKGYGIDRGIEAMREAGCKGALVDVGGDIRCFGPRAGGSTWRVGIRDPFTKASDKMFAVLAVRDRAVCTSGNYFRYVEIGGRRFSHIVDPRTGEPADAAPSVTVVAPTATIADAWATALSVLGPEGLVRIPKDSGIDAMIVVGGPKDFRISMTEGFREFLIDEPRVPSGAGAKGDRSTGTKEASTDG